MGANMAKDEATRKLIEFDAATWQGLQTLGRDTVKTLQELIDEAVRDLLKKHNRPTTLREMLRASARSTPANDVAPSKPAAKSRRK